MTNKLLLINLQFYTEIFGILYIIYLTFRFYQALNRIIWYFVDNNRNTTNFVANNYKLINNNLLVITI